MGIVMSDVMATSYIAQAQFVSLHIEAERETMPVLIKTGAQL